MPAVIAIDGPAASGKSSTARLVARALGWAHLDSGALYRALTLAALDHAGTDASAQRIVALADALPVRLVLAGDDFRPEVAGVDVGEAIREERVTARVSAVAALPAVRAWVNAQQRRAAAEHPRGVVVDGRDIGTVVFPDADHKFFLTASLDEKVRRRSAQYERRGEAVDADAMRKEVELRDRIDSERPVAPLRAADDAVVIDTDRLDLDQVVDRIVDEVRARGG